MSLLLYRQFEKATRQLQDTNIAIIARDQLG